jgi:hypothetical protein
MRGRGAIESRELLLERSPGADASSRKCPGSSGQVGVAGSRPGPPVWGTIGDFGENGGMLAGKNAGWGTGVWLLSSVVEYETPHPPG